MTVGRKPQPAALKLLRGNPGKRPLNENEPKPELQTEIPPRPKWLKGDARKEWDRTIDDVVKMGVLARVDVAQFAQYCYLQGKFIESARRNEVLPGNLIAQCRALASIFGIGPAERARLKVASGESEGQAEEKRFFGT